MSRDTVDLARRFHEALAQRDIETMDALIREYLPAPDVEMESALTGQVYRGRAGDVGAGDRSLGDGGLRTGDRGDHRRGRARGDRAANLRPWSAEPRVGHTAG